MNARMIRSGILTTLFAAGLAAAPAAAHGGRRWGRPRHDTIVETRIERGGWGRHGYHHHHHHHRAAVSCEPNAVLWALVGGAVIGAVAAGASREREADCE
jgi:hypothetical protein